MDGGIPGGEVNLGRLPRITKCLIFHQPAASTGLLSLQLVKLSQIRFLKGFFFTQKNHKWFRKSHLTALLNAWEKRRHEWFCIFPGPESSQFPVPGSQFPGPESSSVSRPLVGFSAHGHLRIHVLRSPGLGASPEPTKKS